MLILNEMSHCKSCHLREGSNQVIPGVGPQNTIMFIGEGPDKESNILGEPFVGRTGKLFTKLLNQSRIDRNQVYITNAVKCFKDGAPTKKECDFCANLWLFREIKEVNPKVIVCLGKLAARTVLNIPATIKTKDLINKSFEAFFQDDKIYRYPAYVMYHPSYLLQHGRQYCRDFIACMEGIRDKYI